MTDGPIPSALRELRADLTRRPVVAGTLALGLILGISGPFDTFDLIPALPRVAYWIAVVAMTFVGGSLVHAVVHTLLRARPVWIRCAVGTCAIGLAVTALLLLFNRLALGFVPAGWREILTFLATVTLISAVVEVGSMVLFPDEQPAPAPVPRGSGPPPILARLPVDKRGALVALSAEDHYVRVTTTKGTDLVLMRLTDAIRETGDVPGLRIHRSHWVATDRIARVTRSGDRGEVTLSDGTTRAISRGYMPAVRDAGLLPTGTGPRRR